MKTFRQFILNEGDDQKKSTVKSEIKLKDSGFGPFVVTKGGPRKNLAILVDAFLKSGEVEFGPKQLGKGENGSGLTKNKMGKKTLYLVGGAVRDHLQGHEPNDYDLTTDATMDEIRLILKNAGFTEVAPRTSTDDDDTSPDQEKYKHLPKSHNNQKVFYIKGTDLNGEEFVMGAKVNGEEFEIATFRKDTKGTSDGRSAKMEFTPNIEEDAERRDFTINAMYIPLTNSNGANDKLLDFHGGALDLKNKKVKFVGNPEDRLKEDQLRAPRYARFAAEFGDEPDEATSKAIEKIKTLPVLQPYHDEKSGKVRDRRGRIYDEFNKGLKKVAKGKVDANKLIGIYKKLGLFDAVFPGMKVHTDSVGEEKDKSLIVAWLLRGNDPDEVYEKLLDAKWSKEDCRRVRFLIGFLNFHPNVNADELEKYSTAFSRSGLSSGFVKGKPMGPPSSIERWGDMNKLHKHGVHAFLQHSSHGDISASPNHPDFKDLYHTSISGAKVGTPAIGAKKKELAHGQFKQLLNSMKKPKD